MAVYGLTCVFRYGVAAIVLLILGRLVVGGVDVGVDGRRVPVGE